MKKSLIMLGALAGLALVGGTTAGLLATKTNAMETRAYDGNTVFYVAGTFNSWTLNQQACHMTYTRYQDYNCEHVSDNPIALSAGDEFKFVNPYYSGDTLTANYFGTTTEHLQNSVDFYIGSSPNYNIVASRNITVTFTFKINNSGDYTAVTWVETDDSKLSAANAFADTFLSATENYCTDSISSDTQSTLKSAYGALGGAKNAFYEAGVVRGIDQTYESKAQQALSRYVNMIEDRGYSDFLELGTNYPATTGIQLTAHTDNNSEPIVIASALSVSGAAVAGFFFIRKKRLL